LTITAFAQLQATTILIYNTGAGVAFGAADTHWTMPAAPAAPPSGPAYTTTAYATDASKILPATAIGTDNGGGNSSWTTSATWDTAAMGGAQWIGPSATQVDSCYDGVTVTTNNLLTCNVTNRDRVQPGGGDGFYATGTGTYQFQTTFDLTGFTPSTAVIDGLWEVDGGGVNILINGKSTGQSTTPTMAGGSNIGSFLTPTLFAITNASCAGGCFIGGVNTITFVTSNGAGESGIRVQFTSATATVPEPGTWFSIASGIGVLAFLRRRR
jgi:hypothetical protein